MPDAAQFVSQDVPTTMKIGHEYDVSITFRNSGDTVWTRAGGYKLGSQSPQDNLRWGTGRVELAAGDAIGHGATRQFRFRIKAPLAPGLHDFQWRMVREHVTWFGDYTPRLRIQVEAADQVPGDGAAFVSQSVPTTMTGGHVYPVRVTMKNIGTTTWVRNPPAPDADRGYKLGAQHPQDNTRWGLGRVELAGGDQIRPGATKTFAFDVRAPRAAGTYAFQWRMVREFVHWFGALTPEVDVRVTTADVLRVKYRYNVIACGYPRFSVDTPADQVNARWPAFGYWKNGVVGGTWMARAQNTHAYGVRTRKLCVDHGIRVLTGWWDVDDTRALDNTIRAFADVDLRSSPLRLAYMFGAQNFRNPAHDSAGPIETKVRTEWAPAAANRDRYAWIRDPAGRERPLVMIWGHPAHAGPGQYRDYLMNRIRPHYRQATGAEPFIVMVNHATRADNVANRVHEALDAVYNHACGFGDGPITTGQSVPLTRAILDNDLRVLKPLRNWEGKPLVYLPGSMPQFDEDRLPREPRYVLAAAGTEAEGRRQVAAMFALVKRYAPTVSLEAGSGDCDVIVNKWVTLTSFNEWPEGATLEPSVVRGRKYQGSIANPSAAHCDYGTDFLDLIRSTFADRVLEMTREQLEDREPGHSIP